MTPQKFAALDAAARHARSFLESLDRLPAGPTAGAEALRLRLVKELADDPLPPEQVIDELVADTAGGLINCAGGRFYAWVVGGALPAALAADWLTSVWDQNAGLHASGPAAALVEEAAGAWLKELLNIPASASFAFVTGCQMAHVTCLAAARHRVLHRLGWHVEEHGLAGSPPIRLLTGADKHGSIMRAVRLLGLGKRNVIALPVEPDGTLAPATLARELGRDPSAPTIVMLQAGELNRGTFDPFADLIPIAKEFDAWVHIDGAFGLWAAASPRLRHLLHGSELADSWATDGHKWLNVPYDSGYAFVNDREAHRASMSHRESYLIHDESARDQMDWTPEWSRRARGFTTYAALRQLGRKGVAELVDRCCERARDLVLGIGALPGAQVMAVPRINQGLLRFFDDDARTDEVIAKVMASGEAFFGGTLWNGMRCMRVSVSNWRTSEADVERTIEAFRRVLSA
jgi:glutamate/tyrosine decarboxylase-like PLP-dependent enzyme